MCSPPCVTSAVPSSIASSSREKPPSSTTTSPSETSFACAKAATCLSSSSEASEKRGMRLSCAESTAPTYPKDPWLECDVNHGRGEESSNGIDGQHQEGPGDGPAGRAVRGPGPGEAPAPATPSTPTWR